MPVFHTHDIAFLTQHFGDGFSHGHGTMSAARAAQPYGETISAFRVIVGQDEAQKVKDMIPKGPRRLG